MKVSGFETFMFLRNIWRYSIASGIAQGIQLVQGFLLRSILTPELIGVWNLVGVMQGFVATFDLGLGQAAARELPLLHGAGKAGLEENLRSTTLWSRVGQSAIFAAFVLVFSFYMAPDGRGTNLLVGGAAAALILIGVWTETYIIFYQRRQLYAVLCPVVVSGAVIMCASMTYGAYHFEISGVIIGAILGNIFMVGTLVFCAQRLGMGMRWHWRWSELRGLLSFGVPMRIIEFPLSLLGILDGLYVAKVMGMAPLGIYATAKTIYTMGSEISSRMGNVYLSRFYNQAGASVDRVQLGSEMRRFLGAQHLLIMPTVIVGAQWIISEAVVRWLPQYVDVVPVSHVLLFGIYFVPQNTLLRNFWIAEKRFRSLGGTNLVALGAAVIGFAALHISDTIELRNVAAVIVLGYLTHFLALAATLGRELWGRKRLGEMLVEMFAAVVYISLVVLPSIGLDGMIKGDTGYATWGRLGAGLLLILPLYGYGLWKLNILNLIRIKN